MGNSSNPFSPRLAVSNAGSYSPYSGVTVTVENGAAYDQIHRLTTQLAGLLQMLANAPDIDTALKNSLWLATSLADDALDLLPFVAKEIFVEGVAA